MLDGTERGRDGEKDGDRWTEKGGGEQRMTSCGALKYGAMRKRKEDRRWMDGCLEEGRRRRGGGGTDGEVDGWSEGGIVVGYAADGWFLKKGRSAGGCTANNS